MGRLPGVFFLRTSLCVSIWRRLRQVNAGGRVSRVGWVEPLAKPNTAAPTALGLVSTRPNLRKSQKRLRPRQLGIAVEFGAAVGPALIPVADAIGRQRLLRSHGRIDIILRAAAGAVSVSEGRLVIPPGALVARCAKENLIADVGMLEPDAYELREVFGVDPDRQPPVIDGRIAEIADAQAGHPQSVLVRIERADRLAERLAHAGVPVRAHLGP